MDAKCGRAQSRRSARRQLQQQRATSTTWMRLPAHLRARLVSRAVLWTKTGNVRDLGTLPGDTSSEASAINNNGDVVGYSKGPQGMRAFLWTQATGMQDLGVLPGGNSSRALGINDMGAVVGSSTSSSGDRAFIWTKQAGMRDLNSAASVTSGVVFVEAHAINNTGQILVMGSAYARVPWEWRSCSAMRAGSSVELPVDTCFSMTTDGYVRTVVSKLSQFSMLL